MLGTSARIGEVLAVRRRDIDITGAPPSIRIAGTIVAHRGDPVQRQDHPKTAKSRRTVAIPSFSAEAVRSGSRGSRIRRSTRCCSAAARARR